MRATITALAMSCCLVLPAATPQDPPNPLSAAARNALELPEPGAASAVATLRAAGPAGLAAFLDEHRLLAATAPPVVDGPSDPRLQRFAAILDRIGAQRDNFAARLYWFTDLELAKTEARRTGRPILSLRLLGRLDEELSCANSRFFRTALYANATVSTLLRDNFVLHWQTVRPVPKVTIDFGDGRRLERTLTGNSIHYVLDQHGNLIDALPGLYGPATFARELVTAAAFARERDVGASARPLGVHWLATLGRLQPAGDPVQPGSGHPDPAIPVGAVPAAPSALLAADRANTKGMVERPILNRAVAGSGSRVPRMPAAGSAVPAAGDTLDATSRILFANKCAPETRRSPTALTATIAAFESHMAADTLQNQSLRRSIIARLLQSPQPIDLQTFNEWVYAELFLTPGSDPWLGLRSDDYTGIDNGGVRR